MLGSKINFGSQIFFGKHHLCMTKSFLVGSAIVDLGGVLLVVLVLLVTWVNQTQAPKLSQKPMSSLCVKFQPFSTPPSDRFW